MSAELVAFAHKIVHISPRVVLDDAIPIDSLIPRQTRAAGSDGQIRRPSFGGDRENRDAYFWLLRLFDRLAFGTSADCHRRHSACCSTRHNAITASADSPDELDLLNLLD
jgi:hypothetical protein